MLRLNMVFIVQVLLITIFVHTCDSKYGEPCKSVHCGPLETCNNNICECRSISLLKYDSAVVATCYLPSLTLNCTACKPGLSCNSNRQCTCSNSSEVMIEDECRTVKYQDDMGKCGLMNNTAYFCNTGKAFCRNRQCLCSKDYFFNQTSKSCLSKKNYTSYHNISAYKARPEEYCLNANDCIDGLRCLKSFTCACPVPCKYKKEHLICDCGKINFQFPTDAILTGIVLGILSILLWAYFIRKTVKKEKKRSLDLNLSDMTNTACDMDTEELNYKCDPIPTPAPPPYTIHTESNNASAPPIGFGGSISPPRPDYNPPPYAS